MSALSDFPTQVLYARTDDVVAISGLAWGLLSDAEQRRGKRLRQVGDQRDYFAAHWLVRLVVARVSGLNPGGVAIVQRCATCGGPHGRPTVVGRPDLHVSLSHGRGVVAAAAGPSPIGVDIEVVDEASTRIAPFSVGEFADLLAPAEMAKIVASDDSPRAFLRQWVRKECLVKLGLVRMDSLATVDLSAAGFNDSPAAVSYENRMIVDWCDPALNVVGAVVADAAATVTHADRQLLGRC